MLGGASGSLSLSAAEAKIAGAASYDGVGAALAAMGDVDGDGREDFAVGAPDAGSSAQAGAVYVFFTLPSGSASVTDADVAVTGAASYDRLGLSIFGGDVDGDGLSDLVAGADGEDTAGLGAGAALLWYGPLGASTPDATLIPDAANDDAGTSVGGADLDGNGAVDPLVGAPGNDRGATSAGALFVFGGGGI
ncbi:MAG: FG-GAP repeat protein [Deltaproteobacteria bacterium]|nr:FG-GAP repeat protein [Deltaproteobacteria bacterium]